MAGGWWVVWFEKDEGENEGMTVIMLSSFCILLSASLKIFMIFIRKSRRVGYVMVAGSGSSGETSEPNSSHFPIFT